MPEILEVETYRRQAELVVGREVVAVNAPDSWYLKHTTAGDVAAAIIGSRVASTTRRGKLLMIEFSDHRPTLGLRFGMTGRLIVDGGAAIEHLEYSSRRNDPAWDRFGIVFEQGELVMRDPRRLGAVELEPDVAALGPDALGIDAETLARSLVGGTGSLKGRLLDQKRIAGLGNLLADEILWRAGFLPTRTAGQLSVPEVDLIAATIATVLTELGVRGGSHCGDLQQERFQGGVCPLDGTDLFRATIAGRTTYYCPKHQH